ncbi:MAG: molybdopterin molybdotransferase MoeA [Acidobacteriota bacterium]|nr:molybdopterin molybdotransferase MoeA [Acidobacteriota bacterium]
MISIAEAVKIIKAETFPLAAETINLDESIGRVLAEEIRADMDLPPFDRSQMDGFALKTCDVKNAPVQLKIVGESIAGKGFDAKLNSGEAIRIMTGAPVPKGADAVQKVELTEEKDGFIKITEKTKVRQNINMFASEIEKGKQIFERGEIIAENMIAAIASFGYAKVEVFKKPKAAILSTGSEIVDIGETPQKDQIRNSNSIMLKVFADRFADVEILPSVKDNIKSLRKVIEKATKNFDVLITTGGVSVGDYDFTKPVLRELGAEIFFEKLSLKPGKPTVFAKLNDCLIFGLPGNPVSSAATFYLFARTALLKMQSAKNCELKKGFAVVSDKIKAAKERDSFLPASLETDKDGKLIIESLRFNGSSNFIAFARADALVFVPQGKNLESGDVAEILFLQ